MFKSSVIIFIAICNCFQSFSQALFKSIGLKEATGSLFTTHHIKISQNGEEVYDFLNQEAHYVFQTGKEIKDPGKSFVSPMLLKGNLFPNSKSRAVGVVDNDLVLLEKSDSATMSSYVFYDMRKGTIVLPLVLIRIDAGYTGNLVGFKRKTDSTVMITVLYKNAAKNSMLIKAWLLKPQMVAGINLPALIGPGDISENLLFNYEVEQTDKLTVIGSDCTEDGSYAALHYESEGSKAKSTDILVWNSAAKTWSTAKLKADFDVQTLNFNPDGYILIYGDGSILKDDFYVINPVKAKEVFSQNTHMIGDYDADIIFSRKGGLYAVVEHVTNSPFGRTAITIHKTKSGKTLATLYLPADNTRSQMRDLHSVGRGYDFYSSDNGIQVVDATADFRYLLVLSTYSDIVTAGGSPSYKPLNQYLDIYSLSDFMKEDDLGLKPLAK